MKRISFSKYDAEHLSDIIIHGSENLCIECDNLIKRLNKFVNEKDKTKKSKQATNK